MKKLVCKKCGNEVLPEKDKALKKEYPYYCSFCDENKYRFECMSVEENKAQKRKELIFAKNFLNYKRDFHLAIFLSYIYFSITMAKNIFLNEKNTLHFEANVVQFL